jgi:hypothetical protein
VFGHEETRRRSKTTLLPTCLTCALLAACHSTENARLARSNSGATYSAPAGTASNTGNAQSSNMSKDKRSDMSQSTMTISQATVQSIVTVPPGIDQGTADMHARSST